MRHQPWNLSGRCNQPSEVCIRVVLLVVFFNYIVRFCTIKTIMLLGIKWLNVTLYPKGHKCIYLTFHKATQHSYKTNQRTYLAPTGCLLTPVQVPWLVWFPQHSVCRGITKEQKHTLRRGFKFQDLTKKRNVWGIKDILTPSSGIIQFLWITWFKFYLHSHPLGPTPDLPPTVTQTLGASTENQGNKLFLFMCTSLSSNITPHCSEAQLTEKQNLEFR